MGYKVYYFNPKCHNHIRNMYSNEIIADKK